MALIDPFGRTINYLRLSVTDRCNLRCHYCMPADGVRKVRHADILTYEELLRIAEAAVAIGMEKIRVTGGEPLLRKGILGFLERLARLPGLKRLVLTTNGILLPQMARQLKDAGIQALNISLDSLQPETFRRITRGGDVNRVLAGIAATEEAGFLPLKINMVVMRGVNDGEIADFAALTLHKPYRVRFIEYMPTLREENWRSLSVPGEELLKILAQRYRLLPMAKESLAGPATCYRLEGAAGEIGIITPVSRHFCHECNRIRVTSTGVAKGCLFAGGGMPLKPVLETGDAGKLREALRMAVNTKPHRHGLHEGAPPSAPFDMWQVGG